MQSRIVNGKRVHFPDSMTEEQILEVTDPFKLLMSRVVEAMSDIQSSNEKAMEENTKAIESLVQPEFDYEKLVHSMVRAMKPPEVPKRAKLLESVPIRGADGLTISIKHVYEV